MSIQPGSTSYFSTPALSLDPSLFDENEHVHYDVRRDILEMLLIHLGKRYTNPRSWTKAWLAGSGVSYQWRAARFPGDLDCLVGIDFPIFRAENPTMAGLSDTEIAQTLNEQFRAELWKDNWHGWELTYYVNADGSDIRAIKPYAAYDLVSDTWTVHPSNVAPPRNNAWDEGATRDAERAHVIISRYSAALAAVQNTPNPAHRANAEVVLRAAVRDGADLFDEIHEGRHLSFNPIGDGYAGWGNYRWQAGKASGVVPALRAIKEYHEALKNSTDVQTYGVELPDARTLIRRAAAYRRPQ